MTYLKLKNNRLRISLTKHETAQIFGNSDNLDKNDPKTSQALKMLFKKAVFENNLDADYGSVLIEIAKNLSGGYDIYFSKGNSYVFLPKNILGVLEFSNCENAIGLSKTILSLNYEIEQSRLYKFADRYRIIVLTKGGIYRIPALLEFADRVYSTRTEAAKTAEHGRLIIKENAIEILANI